MHLLPLQVQKGMTLTSMTVLVMPWGPAHFGAMGTMDDHAREPVMLVATEQPLTWVRQMEPTTRFELEWLHLRRFSADHLLGTGIHRYAMVEEGPNPPDAIAQTDSGPIGVEATALTVPGRRHVYDLFFKLRRRLQSTEPVAFSRLAGHLVYLWFDTPRAKTDKPFRISDTSAVDALVNALAQYEPSRDALSVDPAEALPAQMPPPPLEVTEAGATFYAVPLAGAAPASMLFTLAGFEIALAYPTTITASEAWESIERLVTKHDKPGVDLLVITASGPDLNGVVYPVEEALADFAMRHTGDFNTAPSHIKEVVLHTWMTGTATRLHPTRERLFGPLYTSMVPIHHPWSVAAVDADKTPEAQPVAPDTT